MGTIETKKMLKKDEASKHLVKYKKHPEQYFDCGYRVVLQNRVW